MTCTTTTMAQRAEKALQDAMKRHQSEALAQIAKCNAQRPCYLCPSCKRTTTHRDSDGNSLSVEFSCDKMHEVLAQNISVLEELTFKYFNCPIS